MQTKGKQTNNDNNDSYFLTRNDSFFRSQRMPAHEPSPEAASASTASSASSPPRVFPRHSSDFARWASTSKASSYSHDERTTTGSARHARARRRRDEDDAAVGIDATVRGRCDFSHLRVLLASRLPHPTQRMRGEVRQVPSPTPSGCFLGKTAKKQSKSHFFRPDCLPIQSLRRLSECLFAAQQLHQLGEDGGLSSLSSRAQSISSTQPTNAVARTHRQSKLRRPHQALARILCSRAKTSETMQILGADRYNPEKLKELEADVAAQADARAPYNAVGLYTSRMQLTHSFFASASSSASSPPPPPPPLLLLLLLLLEWRLFQPYNVLVSNATCTATTRT
jgi:hypothetical protein